MFANESFNDYIRLTNTSYWIYRTWTILFLVFGLTGNLFSLMIFFRWMKQFSIYIYFSFLCVINIFILIFDVQYHYFLPHVLDHGVFFHRLLPLTCRFMFFFTYFLRYLFLWTVVFINLDRYFYLTDHSLKKIFCKSNSIRIICCLLILFSALVNGHFLIFVMESIVSPISNENLCLVDYFFSHCRTSNINYEFFRKTIWPIYNIILFLFIPCFIITLSYILIIRNFRFIRENIYKQSQDTSVAIHSKTDHLYSSMKTLICLDLLIPLTIFPTVFFQLYIHYKPFDDCFTIGIINIIFSIALAIIFIKNTFSFLIFYLSGRKFRRAVMKLIYCKN